MSATTTGLLNSRQRRRVLLDVASKLVDNEVKRLKVDDESSFSPELEHEGERYYKQLHDHKIDA